jgi:hypothetical protein
LPWTVGNRLLGDLCRRECVRIKLVVESAGRYGRPAVAPADRHAYTTLSWTVGNRLLGDLCTRACPERAESRQLGLSSAPAEDSGLVGPESPALSLPLAMFLPQLPPARTASAASPASRLDRPRNPFVVVGRDRFGLANFEQVERSPSAERAIEVIAGDVAIAQTYMTWRTCGRFTGRCSRMSTTGPASFE